MSGWTLGPNHPDYVREEPSPVVAAAAPKPKRRARSVWRMPARIARRQMAPLARMTTEELTGMPLVGLAHRVATTGR